MQSAECRVQRTQRGTTIAARFLLALYTLAVLAIVFWPTPVDRPVAGALHEAIEVVRHAGATAVTYNRVEIASNVGMFVPLGVLGVLAFPRARWWQVAIACLVFSVPMELTQLVLLPERTASVLDVAANAAGAVTGALAASKIRHRVRASRGV